MIVNDRQAAYHVKEEPKKPKKKDEKKKAEKKKEFINPIDPIRRF
jgi:hypothetical protein